MTDTLRYPIVLAMNMEEVEMFTAPGEGRQKNLLDLGEAGLAADQKASPNLRAPVLKHCSKLIKFRHWRSLPDIPRKPHRQTPGIFRSPSVCGFVRTDSDV